MRDARCVSLIPRTTLHSDSEHLPTLFYSQTIPSSAWPLSQHPLLLFQATICSAETLLPVGWSCWKRPLPRVTLSTRLRQANIKLRIWGGGGGGGLAVWLILASYKQSRASIISQTVVTHFRQQYDFTTQTSRINHHFDLFPDVTHMSYISLIFNHTSFGCFILATDNSTRVWLFAS
jgi:hypothetical protein